MSEDPRAMRVDHFGIVVPHVEAAIASIATDSNVRSRFPSSAKVRASRRPSWYFSVELIAPTTRESPIKHVLEDFNVSDFLRRNPHGVLYHAGFI
jgi:hypothetical protein